ncbi:uncharacterized protein LOC121378559 [Gigantopelta aegis]|uniref:uncharacterized protein LOC121378559 n=1 Tax=Gigantopelta aegis TaxID=1735272 RepID=UPI001B888963|nr:uncharacterized protein LOC121378559 [Gigantopelta aegis]XP_041362724.1 uncharacterized protein LOC121378559 [Gigantopelta aegis]XP_041362725.1 uncharacterized protein LOC121378559 [Gigantopelta aegis]XP_041362726.1 uncharacterized protein LOC121378559 [Gigantopelta aegis]XP_041362727.1 uncharacterized protein LOC121378559 [Gigantopelta aegis]
MAVNTELAAIIGGCVAGGVLLLSIIACIIYISCGSKRKKRNREKKTFHHSVSDSGGRQSHHSTLSQIDPRSLPKVSSNGLWVDAPGVYTPAPASGYYYGRPGQGYRAEQHGMQRAISERGIPVLPGHPVYQNNVRIYHSQQLAPVYEVIPSGSSGFMNVYEYGELNHSRSRLLERDSAERHRRDEKKVKRSQSDVGRGVDKHHRSKHLGPDRHADRQPDRHADKHSDRHADKHSDRHADKHSDRHSSRHSDKYASQEQLQKHRVSQQKSKSLERPSDVAARPKIHTNESSSSKTAAAYDNPAFSRSSTTEKVDPVLSQTTVPVKHEKVLSSAITLESQVATDSMKLQEKKEQRPVINKTDDEKYVVDDSGVKVQHYVYKGSIYAVPGKLAEDEADGYEENPIVKRMEEMILEKTGEKDVRSAEPIAKDISSSQVKSLPVDPLYSEAAEIVRESISLTASASRNADTGETVGEADKNKEYQSQESHDDLGLKGKNITAEAFQFLDHYLSDDETVESPPISPTPETGFAGY